MKRQGGQTLIEILFAFSVLVIAMSAIVLSVVTSLSNAQYAKNQGLANSYAQEGMAVVRQIRDSSWSKLSGYTTNTAYCLGPSSTDPVPLTLPNINCRAQSSVPAGGIFSREIKFEHESSECCPDNTQTCANNVRGSKATVKVSWSDNKCSTGEDLCHDVELITCFSNLNK